MKRTAVVGSGLAGMGATVALVERGAHVTVFDVGETLDAERAAVVERMRTVAPADWDARDLRLIRENRSRGQLPQKWHFGSEDIYAKDRPFARLRSLTSGRVPYPTFAKGGFSNIWGGAMLPVAACDMRDWPISRADLDPHFAALSAHIPLSGADDDLAEHFPTYRERLGELAMASAGRGLLGALQARRETLRAQGLCFGRARLAVHTVDSGAALACNACGECFAGCVRRSIFSTVPLLEKLVAQGKVTYVPGFFAEQVGEEGGRAVVRGLHLATQERGEAVFDGVFLAGGPIHTARLVLRSRGLYDHPLTLRESQKFAVPALRARGFRGGAEPSLSSIFLEMKVPALSEHWVHAQLVAMNPMIAASIGMRSRLWHPVLRRAWVAWCGLHSDHSSQLELTLRAGDILELGLKPSARAHASAGVAAKRMAKLGRRFGTYFVPRAMRLASPGSGTHCGSSLPMRGNPRALSESDALGRPFGWRNIHVVDSSVLPSIPATTLGFTVMANAHRIGAWAPLEKR